MKMIDKTKYDFSVNSKVGKSKQTQCKDYKVESTRLAKTWSKFLNVFLCSIVIKLFVFSHRVFLFIILFKLCIFLQVRFFISSISCLILSCWRTKDSRRRRRCYFQYPPLIRSWSNIFPVCTTLGQRGKWSWIVRSYLKLSRHLVHIYFFDVSARETQN